ncbi:LOG family protein [Listeria seeligeri]|uniref:LOG family protein n=2 Tax=Listeria seeligeri TaxID=1640 RepID=UPI0010D97949|nr:TIGR00730 family Rossman fold protein [Listeria seeligeri]MBC1420762.1 TIGR00730 family Rossman fold protein [Listeria seeligeri]MBC1423743.1 TIGR00730 family Rossman fold protein [Listeria seeligeri]MBC1428367.1 TIGR00730 family Rossman fold protein [Listeria seeligeri]MBC1442978.1 TIGR00730 family Rossman fold protein [Listeria seeligeri]MBC1471131.1 TIGR00730 family Rossman fold protein [Listeria seeligeri]
MNIVVYCGASNGNNPVYQQAAKRLGEWIVEQSHTLIYGGGKVGLMSIIADTVIKREGEVIGVMPRFLMDRELAHTNITKMYSVNTMAERKQKMLDLGDVCIALPGGPGTLEEITEMISWSRIGQNPNPCILFNENGFYDPLRDLYDSMVKNDFLTQTDRDKTLFSNSLKEINQFITTYIPAEVRRY